MSTSGPAPLAANLSLALTASTPRANPTDTVVFTVVFNNTGNQAAPEAWINLTSPSGFAFLGDTASGNVTGYPNYTFAGVGVGPHAFQVRLEVAVGTAPGTMLTESAILIVSEGSGALAFVGPARASVFVGLAAKSLYLDSGAVANILTSIPPTGNLDPQNTFTLVRGGPALTFDLSAPLARPFRALNVTAVLYLQPLATPATLVVNLSLVDLNGGATALVAEVQQSNLVTGPGFWTLVYAFPSMDYVFAAGHQIRLQVLNTLGSGQNAVLATNATAEPSQLDFETTTYVNVDALQPPAGPTTYLSPRSALAITANVSDPFGSGEIADVRLNVTGPRGPVVTWSSLFPATAMDPSNPSAWALFQYTIPPLLLNGTYSVVVTAIERNGALSIAEGTAVVRAPGLTFQKVASVDQAKVFTRFSYYLWYNNTGSGPAASVWLNDTLPSQVSVRSTSPLPTLVVGTTYRWDFTGVAPGSYVVQINVQVNFGVSGIAFIRNIASLNYSDPQGFLWPVRLSHADVVLNGPVLRLNVTSLPPVRVHSNQTVSYAVTLTNTGDAAQRLWVNATFPSGLTFLSDTSATLGGNETLLSNGVDIVFSNMSAGTSAPAVWRFNMTAKAGPGLPRGTVLAAAVSLNDTSTNGLLMPEQDASVPLTVAAPSVVAVVAVFGLPSAVPNLVLPLFVNFTNAGNEPAATVWINISLDPALSFVNARVPANVVGRVVELVMANASTGPDSAELFVRVSPSVTDGQVLGVSGALNLTDGFGNLLPSAQVPRSTIAVALPRMGFRVAPAAVTAEAGTNVTFTLSGGNTGSGAAAAVWLNLTLPEDLAYLSDTLGGNRSVAGQMYSWSWRDFAPGSITRALVLQVRPLAPDRSIANATFNLRWSDAGGNLQSTAAFVGRVNVIAPSIELALWANQNETLAGRNLQYTLQMRNVGTTMAQTLWLTDTIDPHLQVITYTSPVTATGTTTLNWTFVDVQPGESVTITILVRVADGTPGHVVLANALEAEYTNSQGTVLGSIRASPATTTVVADLMGLIYILVGGTALGSLVVFAVYRRYRVRIEDVFLINHDGILLSHLSRMMLQAKDEDQLSGMLTAVQEFVRDAFAYGQNQELHQLEFGDYHILIERGAHVYLAVVYQGRDSGLVRKKVRSVLEKVEVRYGDVFEKWDGDMQKVAGTHDLLQAGFVDTDHPWSLIRQKAS